LLFTNLCLWLTGYTDFPSKLPTQSSTLYSNNITKFLLSLGGDGRFAVDLKDEVVRGSIVVYQGELLEALPRSMPAPVTPLPGPAIGDGKAESVAITPWQKASHEVALVTAGMGGVIALGKTTGTAFMDNFFTFGLAGLIGYR
jgi:H+-translocating NAD(P) transhydrogenase